MHYRCDKPKVIFEHENIITSKGNMAFAIRASKHSCQLFHSCFAKQLNVARCSKLCFFSKGVQIHSHVKSSTQHLQLAIKNKASLKLEGLVA